TPDGGDPATATVPSDPTIDNPKITGDSDKGYQVTGHSAPNTPITIKDKNGTPIAWGETDGSGTFVITVSPDDVDPDDTITITPEGGDPVTVTVPKDPAATDTNDETPEITGPEVTGNSTDGYHFTGTTDPNTPVTITDNNGDPIATGTSDDKGNIDITIDPGTVNPGETVTATPENGDPVDATIPSDPT
ncbi:Ig-like domain-containing protein, partial [Secundilactobacillus collinoides]|uniref:Ig-like domain-containing protein n=1 Tax=Secundilactobacillus collinoides TaxID=33960 RepID=UPI000A9540ED